MTDFLDIDWSVGSLFLSATVFLKEIIETSFRLLRLKPMILELIRRDQEARGIKKKKLRLEDERYRMNMTPELAGMEYQKQEIVESEIQLSTGCPRMLPEVAYLFFII